MAGGTLRAGLRKMLGVFNLRSGETLTVVFTPEYRGLVKRLEGVAGGLGIGLEQLRIKSARDEEGLDRIGGKYVNARALLLVSRESLTHNRLTLEAEKRGAGVVSMPNISLGTLKRAASLDLEKIKGISDIMAELLRKARRVGITSSNGTDAVICLGKRVVKTDYGRLKAGEHRNFPYGEVCTAPLENRGSGRVFFDRVSYYKDHMPLFLNDAGLEMKNGKITKALNREGKTLYNYISGFRGFNSLAELGIGANPWAGLKGPVVEAEKALGTVHIAFGDNATLGGRNKADIHKDGIISRPTMFFNKRPIIKDGKVVLNEVQKILGS